MLICNSYQYAESNRIINMLISNQIGRIKKTSLNKTNVNSAVFDDFDHSFFFYICFDVYVRMRQTITSIERSENVVNCLPYVNL